MDGGAEIGFEGPEGARQGGGWGGRGSPLLEETGGHRPGGKDHAVAGRALLPGAPDVSALEVDAEEGETLLKGNGAHLFALEFEAVAGEPGASGFEGLLKLLGARAEDDEVVGVADEAPGVAGEMAVEAVEEEIGEEGRERGALGDAAAEAGDAVAVPEFGVNPGGEEREEAGIAVVGGEEVEEEGVVHGVKEIADVGLEDELIATVAPLKDTGDGAIDGVTGAVGEADVEGFLFDFGVEFAGDGGLDDAVSDGGDKKAAGFSGLIWFFDEDFEEGDRAVGVVLQLDKEGLEVRLEVGGEALAGDGVGAGTTAVGVDAEPGGGEVVEGEGIESRSLGHFFLVGSSWNRIQNWASIPEESFAAGGPQIGIVSVIFRGKSL